MNNNIRYKQWLKELGKQIQYLRKRKGMTQADLAKKINMNPSMIGKIETGLNNLTCHTLWTICNGLGEELDIFNLSPRKNIFSARSIGSSSIAATTIMHFGNTSAFSSYDIFNEISK